MRKLVKLAVLALAALGANSIYSNYRESVIEKTQDQETTDALSDVMHNRV